MWWIIPGVVLLFILYILFSRLVIEIDSVKDLYRVRFNTLFSAAIIITDNDEIKLEIRIAWWKKIYDPWKPGEIVEVKPVKKVEDRRIRKKIPFEKLIAKIKGVLKSFRITECFISADTGNMPLNGILYPFVYLLSERTGKKMTINFRGETIIILRIENSLARMLWAYIKS